jgi:hypothetical protein
MCNPDSTSPHTQEDRMVYTFTPSVYTSTLPTSATATSRPVRHDAGAGRADMGKVVAGASGPHIKLFPGQGNIDEERP